MESQAEPQRRGPPSQEWDGNRRIWVGIGGSGSMNLWGEWWLYILYYILYTIYIWYIHLYHRRHKVKHIYVTSYFQRDEEYSDTVALVPVWRKQKHVEPCPHLRVKQFFVQISGHLDPVGGSNVTCDLHLKQCHADTLPLHMDTMRIYQGLIRKLSIQVSLFTSISIQWSFTIWK